MQAYSSIDISQRNLLKLLSVLRVFVVNVFSVNSRHGKHGDLVELRHQHNFANVLSRLDVAMRFSDFIEWKGAIDMRLNPAFFDSTHDLHSPARDLFALVPHVSQVQTEYAPVTIHQPKRMESPRLGHGFQDAQLPS